ncbi:hypothetical protein FF36_00431 [Frankia torreyi]|uniref:Uncharacterized protein n=1 Tax=Frankia torreyi TaxID=1856 RepID=A0A0D8BM49_9ACTN|nr:MULTISPECIES: hypothetical protein [Frankia]KJE25298.1 hypothetical protein FF36_00431 [Frankia torreyi]KQC37197.1 hypothetical protein UK82_17340 [Frankia sp. ACN1ag]
MTEENFDILLDASRAPGDLPDDVAVLDLPPGCRAVDAADALESLFATDRAVQEVAVGVDGRIVGVATRAYLGGLRARVPRSVGDGDGATLPGASLRYEILRYRCPTCGALRRRIHVDERSAPVCPNGHGVLERQR